MININSPVNVFDVFHKNQTAPTVLQRLPDVRDPGRMPAQILTTREGEKKNVSVKRGAVHPLFKTRDIATKSQTKKKKNCTRSNRQRVVRARMHGTTSTMVPKKKILASGRG